MNTVTPDQAPSLRCLVRAWKFVLAGILSACASTPSARPEPPRARVRWLGRVVPSGPESARFAWQGAGVSAIVRGPDIAVRLRTEGPEPVFMQPVIDGRAAARFAVHPGAVQTVSLASGLSPGDHVVALYRDTEEHLGLSEFLGFASGELRGPSSPPDRRIEVIGDSISAGYGNLGSELHPEQGELPYCEWSAETSSWYATYGALAGRALGAEVSTLARSGWGILPSRWEVDNSPGIPAIYDNALGTFSSQPWTFEHEVAALVVNLGTNDWAIEDRGADFEEAYLPFLAHLRARHPRAWIFLTVGSMLEPPKREQVMARLQNVVRRSGDARVSTIALGTQDLGLDRSIPTGCAWHPSAREHERMALILIGELRAKLGW